MSICTFPDILRPNINQSTRDNQLYFFQFPSPFPSFLPMLQSGRNDSERAKSTSMAMDKNHPGVTVSVNPPADPGGDPHTLKRPKSVTFAPETKAPTVITEADDLVMGGVIGRLDIYRSGKVKMCLGNGIALEVSHRQPSYLLLCR
jgi:DNA-directed RNA polymerase III subunit RPC4